MALETGRFQLFLLQRSALPQQRPSPPGLPLLSHQCQASPPSAPHIPPPHTALASPQALDPSSQIKSEKRPITAFWPKLLRDLTSCSESFKPCEWCPGHVPRSQPETEDQMAVIKAQFSHGICFPLLKSLSKMGNSKARKTHLI